MVVDTKANIGYLVHANGEFTSFPVMTGQRKVVHYKGMTYDATTPERTWMAKKLDIQTDRYTFGKTGTFLRLFVNGESTYYGIHGFAGFEKFLAANDTYKSMGCVLVDETMLKVIVQTYELNDNSLELTTRYGTEKKI